MTLRELVKHHQDNIDCQASELRALWKDRNRDSDTRDWVKLLAWEIRASQKNIYDFHMEALKLSRERADKINKLADTLKGERASDA